MWCLIEAHFVAVFPFISRRRFWLLKIWSWLNVERSTKTSNTRSLAFRWIRIKHHLSCCSKYVHLMYMKLTNWMTDWLSDRSNDKQTDRQTADRPTDRVTDLLTEGPNGRLNELSERPTDLATDRPTDRQTDRSTDWPTNWVTYRPTNRRAERPTDCINVWKTKKQNNNNYNLCMESITHGCDVFCFNNRPSWRKKNR